MSKSKLKNQLTPQFIADLLAATPEAFVSQNSLTNVKLGAGNRQEIIQKAAQDGLVGIEGDFVFDPSRINAAEVLTLSAQYIGMLPPLKHDGSLATRSIAERIRLRDEKLEEMGDAACRRLIDAFESSPGYLPRESLLTQPGDESALLILQEMNMLKRADSLIFDPLRISRTSVEAIQRQKVVAPLREQILALLKEQPAFTMPRSDLIERFGSKLFEQALEMGGFAVFSVPTPIGESVWARLESADPEAAFQLALEAVQPKDEDWQTSLDICGETLRPNAKAPEGAETRKDQVIVRSYTLTQAARKLGVRQETVQTAIAARLTAAFVDPEGQSRIPASEVLAILESENWLQGVEDLELIRVRELKIAIGTDEAKQIFHHLRRAKAISVGTAARWGQIRERLTEPLTLKQFRDLYRQNKTAWIEEREIARVSERERREQERRRERERRDEERRQREELRARLLASFPTWQHAGRADQRLIYHVGPTNSGKTHQALEALSEAGSGWYLAPLRLLAFEVFDRLNRRGVRCNLLTGEEHIEVDGATVTAATIEMFNPQRSGNCVVIDEAQMLADADRGWAWTRAMMESQAPEMRIIGPLFSRALVEKLATSAAMPLEVVEHQRLAPLEISSQPWPLENLPERTIVVAFSRRMVLRLKTELEKYKRRVSVVYGNLPPEVRRRQADRFAEGQTEICVATDAVGMGLNLPADNVCFFELEKFDGKTNRRLSASEVHQIGGRAGRFGLSKAGLIGTTTRANLRELRRLYETTPPLLQKARVAPALEDLELIPGSLARRFARWRELQSIPDTLRDVIEPADIDERIALAGMLTDQEVDYLGLASAVQLVNAPTRENSRGFWYACARAILDGESMPMPPQAPMDIESDQELEATESAIACADIYLWLACRKEFEEFGPEESYVRALRAEWSMSIDAALLRKLDTAARCINCRTKLPLNHRYSLCDACYASGRYGWWR